jgi:hypothetical protein
LVPFFAMLSFGNFLRMLDSSPNPFMHSIARNSCKVDFYMIKFLLKFLPILGRNGMRTGQDFKRCMTGFRSCMTAFF